MEKNPELRPSFDRTVKDICDSCENICALLKVLKFAFAMLWLRN